MYLLHVYDSLFILKMSGLVFSPLLLSVTTHVKIRYLLFSDLVNCLVVVAILYYKFGNFPENFIFSRIALIDIFVPLKICDYALFT